MAKDDITDAQISLLLEMPKRVLNPMAKSKTEGRHERTDFKVESLDRSDEFALFTRQSTRLETSYSAGLRWLQPGSESIMLMRCNGSSHEHGNHIEGTKISFVCHVHIATERYLSIGKRDEGFAEPTAAYNSVMGALRHLTQSCNIEGLDHRENGATLTAHLKTRDEC